VSCADFCVCLQHKLVLKKRVIVVDFWVQNAEVSSRNDVTAFLPNLTGSLQRAAGFSQLSLIGPETLNDKVFDVTATDSSSKLITTLAELGNNIGIRSTVVACSLNFEPSLKNRATLSLVELDFLSQAFDS
jgi:hypothetical protein